MIKAIGFDLDDTLYDRNAVYRKVYEAFQSETPCNTLFESFNPVYQDCSKKHYQSFIAGNCSKSHYQLQRTIDAFRTFEYEINLNQAQRFFDLYNDFKNRLTLRPNFHECLLHLKESSVELFLLTNGANSGQRSKIEALELNQYFDEDRIFISEDLACSKPDIEIFNKITSSLGCEKDEIIYIGDEWKNDIEGSLSVGWQAIYFNVHNKPILYKHPFLKEIHFEKDLCNLLYSL
ncbi:HAD family hydrolase [Facklamia sp. 7083-14-GEN3]|uniref:HAD family hydrolase n=1 Tax=Facklamia sp. 7083-14-GEN3 TaxID=2973478 RepID=UPI00215CB613|nr:HAD family hydrolase [Facklamia sp. 7083-14-GEN3]MCR8969184.1 HAD family hydrolase [Facklamia sp. 7083-14-GEN3]